MKTMHVALAVAALIGLAGCAGKQKPQPTAGPIVHLTAELRPTTHVGAQ